jgi:hypothetical protein
MRLASEIIKTTKPISASKPSLPPSPQVTVLEKGKSQAQSSGSIQAITDCTRPSRHQEAPTIKAIIPTSKNDALNLPKPITIKPASPIAKWQRDAAEAPKPNRRSWAPSGLKKVQEHSDSIFGSCGPQDAASTREVRTAKGTIAASAPDGPTAASCMPWYCPAM